MKIYLTELMLEKDLTMRELSNLSGIPYSTLWDIEQKNHTPSLENYIRLCRALGINPYNELLRKN